METSFVWGDKCPRALLSFVRVTAMAIDGCILMVLFHSSIYLFIDILSVISLGYKDFMSRESMFSLFSRLELSHWRLILVSVVQDFFCEAF